MIPLCINTFYNNHCSQYLTKKVKMIQSFCFTVKLIHHNISLSQISVHMPYYGLKQKNSKPVCWSCFCLSTTESQPWQVIKKQLVPTPPVQNAINLLPSNRRLGFVPGANRNTRAAGPTNPRQHSNMSFLYQGATPLQDTAYLWPPRREQGGDICLKEQLWTLFLRLHNTWCWFWNCHLQYYGTKQVKEDSEEVLCWHQPSAVIAS